jgi:hypothetical protein
LDGFCTIKKPTVLPTSQLKLPKPLLKSNKSITNKVLNGVKRSLKYATYYLIQVSAIAPKIKNAGTNV